MKIRTAPGVTGRNHKILGFWSLLAVTVMLAGCNDRAPSPVPTAPSSNPPPSSLPAATYTLSGDVSELTANGLVPIQDATVIEPVSGRKAVTDANGRYSMAELPAATRSFSIAAPGYLAASRTVTISGDTQLDIRLERIVSYTLSGVVFELADAGPVPIEGVELYCDSCGSPVGHTFVYTDAKGFYSFEWSQNGTHPLFVTKAGYAIHDPTGTLLDINGRITATVLGDTTFDVQLVKR